ncbi:G-protein coupled receptor moody [Drosophila grimshawi]|uniref:GH24563 n=1 Tax=Drosophila grimshawi TaxID=7222 RepID=B4JM26_DROGR|nr:G-protein coupled receptor moody [Drosophila grimshawi]EDV91787.1 GH24563 [Drosophila grimshawi]
MIHHPLENQSSTEHILLPVAMAARKAATAATAAAGVAAGNRSHVEHLDNELFEGYSETLLTVAWTFCILFTVVGVPGNLLTIVALSRSKQTRNSTAIFIINLSCSDLLFGCFNLPLAAATFMERAWTFGDLLCRLFPLLRYGLLAVSLLSVSLITINRYIIIAHPRQYPRIYQRRYLAMMVAGTWLITFSIMIPTWRGVWGRFGLDTSIGSCSILHDKYDRSPKEFLFIAAFMLPCICIVICYARIFLLVRQATIRAGNKSQEVATTPTTIQPPNDKPKNRDKQPDKTKVKDIEKHKDKDKDRKNTSEEGSSGTRHAFVVSETFAFIDDNTSSESFPISYSTSQRQPHRESPIDANIVLQDLNDHSNNKQQAAAANPADSSISRSQSQLEQNRNAKNPITTSLRTSFTRFSPRKSHYVSMGNTSNASSIYPGRMSPKDRRLLKMILVIFVWFVVCYLPITLTKIWKSANDMHVFNITSYILIYMTTCINPLIYVLMSKEYRRAYSQMFRCQQTEQQHRVLKKHIESNRAAPKT